MGVPPKGWVFLPIATHLVVETYVVHRDIQQNLRVENRVALPKLDVEILSMPIF